MTLRVIIGTIATVLTLALLGWAAINEPARMAAFEASQAGRSIENGAALFESNCTPCHGKQGEGIPGVAPALNNPALFNGQRLKEVGFQGTVPDFIRLTISAGRPIPSAGTNYPQRMPTWSQRYGGPLRDDQIDDLVAFIMNWQTSAGGAVANTPAAPAFQPVGTSLDVTLPAGDPTRGETLFNGTASLADGKPAGCSGCHVSGAGTIAPDIQGIATRAGTRKAGYSAEKYIHESIVQPNAYVVQGFNAGVMPQDFGQRMSAQNLADIIAYLMTLK